MLAGFGRPLYLIISSTATNNNRHPRCLFVASGGTISGGTIEAPSPQKTLADLLALPPRKFCGKLIDPYLCSSTGGGWSGGPGQVILSGRLR